MYCGSSLPGVNQLFQLGVCNISAHDNGAGERQTSGYRVLRKLGEDLFHRAVKVNFQPLRLHRLAQFLWNVLAWVVFQFFDPDTFAVDFRFNVTVSGAGDAHADRAGCAVTWQTDNANVVREVFTAKLRAKTEFLGLFQQFLFQLDIAGTPDHVRSLPSAVHRNSERLLT
ncbi:Uncharacterised protein [Escherichia coli]|uniref:Uncharacterized protein n=1 Tax=Escherichia coli TaxID=562 RepID=A0A376TMM0_ECOLX|nr:Uncharacterised protein [Escherichia coli]